MSQKKFWDPVKLIYYCEILLYWNKTILMNSTTVIFTVGSALLQHKFTDEKDYHVLEKYMKEN